MSSADQVRASHILIKHAGSRRKSSWRDLDGRRISATSRDEAVAQLKILRDDILSGNASFDDVASRLSDCNSAKRGGDLGPFSRGRMQRPFEEATFSLKTGEISDIVDTDSGVHIIMRTDLPKKIIGTDEQQQVRASHILTKHKESRRKSSWKDLDGRLISATKKADAVAQLKTLRDGILNGTTRFEDVASRLSDCNSAKRGGDLGPFCRGQMQKPFEDATFRLKVGEVSDIVETESGVHIIMRTG